MVGRDQTAARTWMSCQRRVREHQWFCRDGRRPLHEIVGAVRYIHHDPERIAAAHDVRAKIGQAAMNGRLCLNVAEFIDPIMRQLKMPKLMERKRLVDMV